ncbi:MAG: thioredoxin [Mycoplasmatota bacterium]
MLKYATKENFNEIIKEEKVLVDFYANWCGPCKMISPVLEELSKDYEIVKVNIDDLEEIAYQFKVMSIPTLILFKNGIEDSKKIGYLNKEEIKEWID